MPSDVQRETYETLPKGDCNALDDYRKRFPKSPFDEKIQRRMLFKREIFSDNWTARAERRAPRYVSAQMTAFDSEKAAIDDARSHAMASAKRECSGDNDLRRFVSATIDEAVPACRANTVGHIYALHYEVICMVQTREITDVCG